MARVPNLFPTPRARRAAGRPTTLAQVPQGSAFATRPFPAFQAGPTPEQMQRVLGAFRGGQAADLASDAQRFAQQPGVGPVAGGGFLFPPGAVQPIRPLVPPAAQTPTALDPGRVDYPDAQGNAFVPQFSPVPSPETLRLQELHRDTFGVTQMLRNRDSAGLTAAAQQAGIGLTPQQQAFDDRTTGFENQLMDIEAQMANPRLFPQRPSLVPDAAIPVAPNQLESGRMRMLAATGDANLRAGAQAQQAADLAGEQQYRDRLAGLGRSDLVTDRPEDAADRALSLQEHTARKREALDLALQGDVAGARAADPGAWRGSATAEDTEQAAIEGFRRRQARRESPEAQARQMGVTQRAQGLRPTPALNRLRVKEGGGAELSLAENRRLHGPEMALQMEALKPAVQVRAAVQQFAAQPNPVTGVPRTAREIKEYKSTLDGLFPGAEGEGGGTAGGTDEANWQSQLHEQWADNPDPLTLRNWAAQNNLPEGQVDIFLDALASRQKKQTERSQRETLETARKYAPYLDIPTGGAFSGLFGER